MATIVITQKNWDGKGNDREFIRHPENTASAVLEAFRSIRSAYNFEGKATVVTLDGVDVTSQIKFEYPNPHVAFEAYKGGTIRYYADGMVDWEDRYSLSPGFNNRDELTAWHTAEKGN